MLARIYRCGGTPAAATQTKAVALDAQRRELPRLRHLDREVAQARAELLGAFVGVGSARVTGAPCQVRRVVKRGVSAGQLAALLEAISQRQERVELRVQAVALAILGARFGRIAGGRQPRCFDQQAPPRQNAPSAGAAVCANAPPLTSSSVNESGNTREPSLMTSPE